MKKIILLIAASLALIVGMVIFLFTPLKEGGVLLLVCGLFLSVAALLCDMNP